MAFGALRANKLRSFLTLLGNIIGVTFVIAILAVTQGMTKYVAEKVVDQGSNVFWVDKFGMVNSWDLWLERSKRKDLSMEDLAAIQRDGTNFGDVGAARQLSARVKHRNRTLPGIGIIGVSDGHPEAMKYPLLGGRHLASADVERRHAVAVIGFDVYKDLFPGEDPVGKELRIGNATYTVVGYVEQKGSVLGESQDNFVAIPLTTYEKQYGKEDDLRLSLQALDPEHYNLAQDEARALFRTHRKVPPGKPDDFEIMTSEMFMQLYNNFTGGAYMVMIFLAGISLVVGGIGIMNIMLVSVTERTREIGIRKSIGARRGDILRQFLLEAVVLGMLGGALGVAFGAGLAMLVKATTPLPATILPWMVALGLSVASGVGLFFGIWPAMKAARLDPIVALRFE
jgi:putative ABC transport system permease protein